ncbi:hypothetical protein GGI20_002021 [Coemansia sp. BCRC 34301]|nr:hypothetical protein GGI20_002021 [Coemansia sp. BCRC 34301]
MAGAEIDSSTGSSQAGEHREPAAASTSLYEDKYLVVTADGITVRRYYFPLMEDKFIRWEDIEYVKTAQELEVKWYAIKEWGMALGNIWWNCASRFVKCPPRDGWGFNGMDYILRTNIVIKVRNSSTRPGSFVEHRDDAMAAIASLVQLGGHSHVE